MISINHLSVDFGKQELFNDINFVISQKERIALVGKNGAGKSTLLKIIAGEESPSKGEISIQKGIRLGYLPQVMKIKDTATLYEEVEKVFSNIKELEDEVKILTKELENRSNYNSNEYDELINLFSSRSEQLLLFNQGNYLAEIERTLTGLGFERSDFSRPTKEFSGGWRMRIELAKILLQKPDILLLDEPTNHLDIESIEWLENFIKKSGVTLLLVSHDKTFLDATTNRTIEIELGNIYDYKTNYSHYVNLRQERLEQQKRAYENQKKMIDETEAFIERFRYQATKAVQVQSRIKHLEKIERIQLDLIDTQKIHFQFPPAERSGDFPLIIENLSKSYGEKAVLQNINLSLKRGEKVAFVGKNGMGKSTLVKSIIGEILDFTGNLKIGHNIKISYFSQNRANELDPNLTIRETIDQIAKGPIREKINNMLGAFMFGGELADKPVAVLSGGERARLAILALLLEPANFLILDEPTNHLDLKSKDVLKEAINTFDGTVIIVSHDRDFLNDLVNNIFEFENGKINLHLGGIQEYLYKKRSLQDSFKEDNLRENTTKTNSSAKKNYQQQKEKSKEKKILEKSLQKIEEKITILEKELKNLEEQLSLDSNDMGKILKKYEETKKILDNTIIDWEDIAEKMSLFQD